MCGVFGSLVGAVIFLAAARTAAPIFLEPLFDAGLFDLTAKLCLKLGHDHVRDDRLNEGPRCVAALLREAKVYLDAFLFVALQRHVRNGWQRRDI